MLSVTKPTESTSTYSLSLLCGLFSDSGGQPTGEENAQQLNERDSDSHSDQGPRIVLHFILELHYAAILEVLVLKWQLQMDEESKGISLELKRQRLTWRINRKQKLNFL